MQTAIEREMENFWLNNSREGKKFKKEMEERSQIKADQESLGVVKGDRQYPGIVHGV